MTMDSNKKMKLPDDVVQYCFYLTESLLDVAFMEQKLTLFIEKCLAVVLEETHGHIWQNQSFNLHLIKDEVVPHLFGSTNFGDSIDDEWLIVYLVHRITKIFPELIAKVFDNDGQFLLIEAAEHLPNWLTPDTCENRVFVSSGLLHILPKPTTPGNIPYSPVENPTLLNAINTIALYPSETVTSERILSCIEKRISVYPQKALNDNQLTNVYIPHQLVYILDQMPHFISMCVQAFYLRDPLDLRTCRIFSFMPPENRVWTQIAMSKLHYAQLMQQHFAPDKKSGYNLSCKLNATEEKGVDLGMKIAHGCEIMCSKAAKTLKNNNGSLNFDICSDSKFLRFVNILKNSGYFRHEAEGSKGYRELHSQAKQYYTESLEACLEMGDTISHKVVQLLIKWKNKSSFPQLQTLQIKSTINELPEESSDKWLYIEESDMNEIAANMNEGFASLQERHSKSKHCDTSFVPPLSVSQLSEAAEKVHDFLNKDSDYSGVEVDNQSSINFNSEEFVKSLAIMLNIDNQNCENVNLSSGEEESDDFLSDDDDENVNTYNESQQSNVSEMVEYMKHMDSELAKTAVGESFVKKSDSENLLKDESKIKEKASVSGNAVDIDVNLLKNFLEGADHEKSSSGPITNILGSIGANLP